MAALLVAILGCRRLTERSEAGRNSPEAGILGGAQSFDVTELVEIDQVDGGASLP